MALDLRKQTRLYKKLFALKSPQKDGLLLNIHHTDTNSRKLRLVNGCFHENVFAVTDIEGNIFVLDFQSLKSWNLPNVTTSVTAIRFPDSGRTLVVGSRAGEVFVVDVEILKVIGRLLGHKLPVTSVSFSGDSQCLTASSAEAVVWDLKSFVKLHVLHIEQGCNLKFVSFMPVSNNILGCFGDNYVQIWKFDTFEVQTQLPPLLWYNQDIRSVAFTNDGKTMVLACRAPYLALILLSNFKLLKFITLPEHIQSIKSCAFLPQPNDGGSNKLLAVLSGRGSIHFYDVSENTLMSELIAPNQITRFSYSPKSNTVACILSSGDVNIYDITPYITLPIQIKPIRAQVQKRCSETIGVVKEQVRAMLHIEKLRVILKEWGEYPDAYRPAIWERLLELPRNTAQYNALINHRMIVSFEDLGGRYPLQNKRNLKNLRQLLDNLVTWCPFFCHVDYLPALVFPFLKLFCNNPIVAFEAMCTIIVNWCQFWFEYFPLPPVNILAIVENVLMEHDPELLHFFVTHDVTGTTYAWPILRTAFSEILTAAGWKQFWDHVLTNEPSFLLCAIVAYNILQRAAILKLSAKLDFHCFYNTHHPVDVKKLIVKTYAILEKTSETIHPRQYLGMFKKLKPGEYPNFCDYPKTAVNHKTRKEAELKQELDRLNLEEADIFLKRIAELNDLETAELQEVEKRRLHDLELAIKEQVLQKQETVHRFYERLARVREKFRAEDVAIASLKDKMAKKLRSGRRASKLSSKLGDVVFDTEDKRYAVTKIEDEILERYAELLSNKAAIESLLRKESTDATESSSRNSSSEEQLKVLNAATGVAAIDALMKRIEIEIEKERQGISNENTATGQVSKLQAEVNGLLGEIDKLLQLLLKLKKTEH